MSSTEKREGEQRILELSLDKEDGEEQLGHRRTKDNLRNPQLSEEKKLKLEILSVPSYEELLHQVRFGMNF